MNMLNLKRSDQAEPLTRKFCVEHVYPRILYAFSDVICFVTQQANIAEDIVERLIKWADKVHLKSLNQVALPHALIVVNQKPISCSDERLASSEMLGKMQDWKLIDSELGKIAAKWNDLLPEGSQVKSMRDLLLRYFGSINVVHIPHIDAGPDQVHRQFQQLRTRIENEKAAVQGKRWRAFSQINAVQLETYLNAAFNHFSKDINEPFDFFKYSLDNNSLPEGLTGHATRLMSRIREKEWNAKWLDKRSAEIFSSYITLRIVSKEIRRGMYNPCDRICSYFRISWDIAGISDTI